MLNHELKLRPQTLWNMDSLGSVQSFHLTKATAMAVDHILYGQQGCFASILCSMIGNAT